MTDLSDRTFKYKKGDTTVLWKPGKCIHSGICAKGLSAVFKPSEKPWIQLDGASTHVIVEHVSKCPSGALSIEK